MLRTRASWSASELRRIPQWGELDLYTTGCRSLCRSLAGKAADKQGEAKRSTGLDRSSVSIHREPYSSTFFSFSLLPSLSLLSAPRVAYLETGVDLQKLCGVKTDDDCTNATENSLKNASFWLRLALSNLLVIAVGIGCQPTSPSLEEIDALANEQLASRDDSLRAGGGRRFRI